MDFKMDYSRYKQMNTEIGTFQRLYKRLPNYYTIKEKSLRLNKKDYLDAQKRVNQFITCKKRNPSHVMLHNVYKVTIQPARVVRPKIWADMENALGTKFNNATELYKALSKKDYKYYIGDEYDYGNAMYRLKKNLGVNCVDITQLLHAVLTVMGYNSTMYRADFKCGGHAFLWVKGKEFKSTVVFDGAAALKGIRLGEYLCSGKYWNLVKNPKYIIKDDGV